MPLLRATRILLEKTSRASGNDFFRGLASGIAAALGMKYGLVGVVLPGTHSVRTRAVWGGDRWLDDFEYGLAGTPCADVLEGVESCFHHAGVARDYPEDLMLAELGIESYFGIPVRDAENHAVGLLVAMHDQPIADVGEDLEAIFTLFAQRASMELERLEADARLRASEARYRQIVTSCHEGVWTIDAEGHTTFVNEQMARMFGYTVDEMLGRSMYDFMSAEARQIAEKNLARRARGIAEQHDFCFTHKDGSEVWTILSTSPLRDEQGNYMGALAMATDVTQRRALELKVQHAQKLESLGVLAGGIAHDFNNLLVGILANSSYALRKLPSADPKLRSSIEDVQTAAVRAAELTKQMLAYSGRGPVSMQPLDLNELVEEIAQLLATVVSKRARVEFSLAAELPRVRADAAQLRQIVMNLMTNASDALGEQNGVIAIATGVVQADRAYLESAYLDEQLDEGRYVYIEVRDSGMGMDLSTRERIFDPFFTTKFTGRGLGLAAVLGILRGHRGAVKVDSAPGRGTTFRVLLPCPELPDETDDETDELSAPAEMWRGSGTVLVADDEELVRKVATRVLEAAGFDILPARDGNEAVALFSQHADRIAAVVLDMTMPGMSGDEVLRHIRERRPNVLILLSSGYEPDAIVDRLGEEQGVGFLRKPWSPAELVAAMRAVGAGGPLRV